MEKFRLPLLLLVALGLAVFFWFDNESRKALLSDKIETPLTSGQHPDGLKQSGSGEINVTEKPPIGQVNNPLAILSLESLLETVSRPLFSPDRKPGQQQNTALQNDLTGQVATAKPDEFVLLGVVKGNGQNIALLRSKRDGRNLRLETGDNIGEWRVTLIDINRVKLQKNGKTINLPLFQE